MGFTNKRLKSRSVIPPLVMYVEKAWIMHVFKEVFVLTMECYQTFHIKMLCVRILLTYKFLQQISLPEVDKPVYVFKVNNF